MEVAKRLASSRDPKLLSGDPAPPRVRRHWIFAAGNGFCALGFWRRPFTTYRFSSTSLNPKPLLATMVCEERNFLFSSESVNEGHPDKLSDQVSDAVLDACLKADPFSKVACETATKDNMVMVSRTSFPPRRILRSERSRSTATDSGMQDNIWNGISSKWNQWRSNRTDG